MQTKVEYKNKIQNSILLLCCTLLCIAIIFTAVVVYKNEQVGEKIDKDEVLELKILATEEQIQSLIENVQKMGQERMLGHLKEQEEPYIKVDVSINGKIFKNCGLRTKGSSIYSSINHTDKPTRYGYRLELDYYTKNQSYDGISKFSLNTAPFDKTSMKEMVCYDVYEKAGVKVAKRCFCNLTLGEKNEGIYTLVEIPGESFLKRNYGNNYGILYKPNTNKASGQSVFLYNGDSIEHYKAIIEGEKYGRAFDSIKFSNYLASIKSIIEDKDMEEYIDVPSVIDYLVGSMLINNGDSFVSQSSRNFYVYQEGKKLTLLPFDLDLYFRENQDINKPILDYAIFNTGRQQKPIFYHILTKEIYQEEYKEKIKKLIGALEEDNYIDNRIEVYQNLISDSIKNNENNFYSYDTFENAVDAFHKIIKLRLSSAKKQLDANIWNEYIEYETPIEVEAISADTKMITNRNNW